MARKLRIQYPGAIYHVMSRGDRREPIFVDDHDRERFLETLTEACQKTGWQLHAFCLMSNHFHLVLETPQANLVAGMQWFLGTYTSRFNRRHKWTEADLTARRKGDPGKVRLAAELRSRSTMPLQWIAERLSMGSRGYLTWLLQRQPQAERKENQSPVKLI